MYQSARLARYAFCGNRFHVLESMLEAGLQVTDIAAMTGSHLEKALLKRQIPFVSITGKETFLNWLSGLDVNIFLANGCPYIVPVAAYPDIYFINIHPSFLPDLRGADPVPAAILFARDAGATCHVMDKGIDTGDIISQERIAYNEDWDVLTLYKLCFDKELEMFRQALARDFAVIKPQNPTGNEIYYSFKAADLQINFSDDAYTIRRRVLAFCNPNKLARFTWKNTEIRIAAVDIDMNMQKAGAKENEVIMVHENTVTLKKGDAFLKLHGFDDKVGALAVGDVLA